MITALVENISDDGEANIYIEQSELRTLSRIMLDLLNNPTYNVQKYLTNEFKVIVLQYFRSSNYKPIGGEICVCLPDMYLDAFIDVCVIDVISSPTIIDETIHRNNS